MTASDQFVKVWDGYLRFFHWSAALAFMIAYLTEEDWLTLHVAAGYFLLILLATRIVWGIIGTHYARFSSFIFSPSTVWRYLKDTLLFKAGRHLGHNPAGGLMILLLLTGLLITGISGLAIYGVEDHAGPLAGVLSATGEAGEETLEAIHEFFANLTLFLVFVHLAGVVVESLLHRENLVAAMISGFKRK